MLTLFKRLFTLVQQFGLSFSDLSRIIDFILHLPNPPAIADDEELRKWIITILGRAGDLAEEVEFPIVDNSLEFIENAIRSDFTWDLIYKLLLLVFNRDSVMRKSAAAEYGDVVAATSPELSLAQDIISSLDQGAADSNTLVKRVESTTAGLSPGMLVTLIVAIVELWKLIRRERSISETYDAGVQAVDKQEDESEDTTVDSTTDESEDD